MTGFSLLPSANPLFFLCGSLPLRSERGVRLLLQTHSSSKNFRDLSVHSTRSETPSTFRSLCGSSDSAQAIPTPAALASHDAKNTFTL
nr:hypothetical protein CFP56_38990 [Quercus suber]